MICSNPPASASPAACNACNGVNACAEYTNSTTVLITPTSAAVVPSETSIPAANAPTVATITATTLLWAVNPPNSTALEHQAVEVSIRFARRAYGSLPSEYDTFNAPLATASPPCGMPIAKPTISGATTPIVFRSACHALIFERSTCVTIRHSAFNGLGWRCCVAAVLRIAVVDGGEVAMKDSRCHPSPTATHLGTGKRDP